MIKYVFVIVNVDVNNNVFKDFNTNLDKRENFDDMNLKIIIAQNICFFDIANKQDSIKLNISNVVNEIKIVDEIERT